MIYLKCISYCLIAIWRFSSSNPKINVFDHGHLEVAVTWYTWQTDGWSTCMHVLVPSSLFCLSEEILHCQFPVLQYESATITNTKLKTKCNRPLLPFLGSGILVNTARKTKT